MVLYDKFDLWQVAADGSRDASDRRAGEQVRHRYVRVNPDEKWIDLDSPIYVSLFGLWSKKSGYGRLMPDNGVERLVFLDKSVTGLGRAKDGRSSRTSRRPMTTRPTSSSLDPNSRTGDR